MPLVSKPSAFACRAERLARAAPRPNRSGVGVAGAPQCVAPDTDSREEVALRIASQVIRSYIFNAPFVYVAGGDVPRGNQVAQHLGREGVYFIVVTTTHLIILWVVP